MARSRDEVPELRQHVRELHKQVGRPTYKVLESAAARLGQPLPRATIGERMSAH